MVHLARLAAFHHQADLVAQALADQVVMHRGGGEQGGDRDALGRDGAIGQDQDVVVGQHRVGRLAADAIDRALACPTAPSAAGHVVSIVQVRNAPPASVSIVRILSRSALVRIGCDTSSR